jgi:protein TonB
MFEQLPETKPHKNKRKLEAFFGAFGLQILLVGGFIALQMAMPEKLGKFQLLTTLHMAAPPPPPPAPISAAPEPLRTVSRKAAAANQPVAPIVEPPRVIEREPEVVAPTTIPKEIARIDEGVASAPRVPAGASGGVPGGGVPGGLPGGLGGGVLSGVLGGAATPPALPPPTEPVRVGGNVKPPKIVHIEQPHYPPTAKRARIEGVVVIEAVVTADGTVDKVKVISGPQQLVDAAVEAIKQWKYEPTFLNGQAVPVILTARIDFSLSDSQK